MENEIINIKGLNIATYKISGLSTISINLRIRAGSWYEDGDNWGKSHLIEHMLFQGSKSFPRYEDLEIFGEDNSISWGAYTSGSQINITIRSPKETLKNTLKFLLDPVFYPLFEEESIKKEKKIIDQEYLDKWSKIDTRFNKGVNQQIYGETHPYIRDGIGDAKYVSGITRDELIESHNNLFVASNMSMGIAGDFQIEELKNTLEQLLPDEKPAPQLISIAQPKTSGHLYEMEDATQKSARIYLTWPIQGSDVLDLKKQFVVSIANYLLEGTRNSVLYRKIREEMGLAYSVGASFVVNPLGGNFQIYMSVNPENIQKATSSALAAISEVVTVGIKDDVFLRAKNRIKSQKTMSFDSTSNIANSLCSYLFWDNLYMTPESFSEYIDSITKEDVEIFIKKYLCEAKPLLSILKPINNN